MSALAHEWWAWMAPMAVQAGLLALVVAVADLLLGRFLWPQLRHALWLLVALKLLLPPTLAAPTAVVALPAAAPPSAPVAPFLAWAAGALLLAALGGLRLRRVRQRLLRGAVPAPSALREAGRRAAARLRLRRLPRLLVTEEGTFPAVLGVVRPVVVLPRAFLEDCSPAEAEHVLLHELAHVKRGDLLAQAAFTLLNLVYWFHPLVWLARRRAHDLRELCCDATVAAALGPEAPAYRATLLRAAGRLLRPAGGLGFGPGALLARLAALQRPPWRRPRLRRAATALLALALGCALLPMGPQADAELADARRDFAELLAAGDAGCLRLRAAALRVQALEQRTP